MRNTTIPMSQALEEIKSIKNGHYQYVTSMSNAKVTFSDDIAEDFKATLHNVKNEFGGDIENGILNLTMAGITVHCSGDATTLSETIRACNMANNTHSFTILSKDNGYDVVYTFIDKETVNKGELRD